MTTSSHPHSAAFQAPTHPCRSGLLLGLLLCLMPGTTQADDIRRIVHPDGRVEYTNVAPSAPLPGGKRETIYKYRQLDGTLSFTNQKPVNLSNYEVLRFDCYACRVNSHIDWNRTPLNRTAYASDVDQAARQYKVDPALVRAVIHAESAFKANARSNKGALGLMQLMPATAEELGVTNALDEQQNIAGGTRYLAALLERYKGDARLATAAYNAGPGAVAKYKGIPPYAETQAYVKRVGILHKRYQQTTN